MPEQRLHLFEVLGGGKVYQRVDGGKWHLYLWLSKEKKQLRQCLETTDKRLAGEKANELVFDCLKRQAAGQRVLGATLGQVVDAWEQKHQLRLEQGELRSKKSFENHTRFFRKHLAALYGLDTPVSKLTQGEKVDGEPAELDWDRYVPYRLKGDPPVALDTVRGECAYLRALVKQVGLDLGASVVPEFNLFVPPHLKSKRQHTFTREEFQDFRHVLRTFPLPDTNDGKFVRNFAATPREVEGKGRRCNQDLERTRRVLLRYLVETLAFSGCRPHELAGPPHAALRWCDVEFKEFTVNSTELNRTTTKHEVAVLKVRPQTKTGARSVPTLFGKQLKSLRKWSKHSNPEDFVFAEQTGLKDGNPVDLDALREQFREVVARCKLHGWSRFKPDLYTLRHYFATERLTAGVEPFKVAKLLGHSLAELERTYAHLLTAEERFVRSVWKETTPAELAEVGVVVVDPAELK